MGQMLVFSNAVEGRDDEFNKWYDEVHVVEMMSVPGYTAARRMSIADGQLRPERDFRYLAVYDYEGTSEDAVAALKKAIPTFNMSDTVADTKVVLYE